MRDLAGYQWLSKNTGIAPVQPFAVKSMLGGVRKTVHNADHTRVETYPQAMRPADAVDAHLMFAFRHEIIHLEFLSRLFQSIDPGILEAWSRREPAGQYARRACFFYEWLTGRHLDLPDVTAGNYVDALNSDEYLVATRPVNVQRWRVRDNLPGKPEFCPLVVRTDAVRHYENYDCAKALADLEVEYGAEILLRSAMWLSIKESRASFQIEHEERHVDRVRRFAAAMERRCGKAEEPLDIDALTELQTEILGEATRYGIRKSPVFVGCNDGYEPVVDYVAPDWKIAPQLLFGLSKSMERTRKGSPVIRAAVASFGFVFIHPMADGNGRISRFLVNDVLRRDGAVPDPFILPISATIMNSTHERVGYDRVLERFSRPLMQRFADRYKFGAEFECEDGIRTNFYFDAYDEAMPVWRFPDLTAQVEYLGHVLKLTIEREMSAEAIFLRDMERAREAVKNYLEGPNTDIDKIIRSLRENQWKVSGKLIKAFPQLENATLAEEIVGSLREVFDPPAGGDEANEPAPRV